VKRERHLYVKYLTASGHGPHLGFKYSLPSQGKAGKWIPKILRVANPVMCDRGFHAVADHGNIEHLLEWQSDRAFVLEYEKPPKKEGSKVVGGNCRLLAEITPNGLVHPKAKQFKKVLTPTALKKRYDELKAMLMRRVDSIDGISEEDDGFLFLLRVCMKKKIKSTGHCEMDTLLRLVNDKKATNMEDLLHAFQDVFTETWFDDEETFVNDTDTSSERYTRIPQEVLRHAIEEAGQLFKWSAPSK
jgi:hypothetical protein